MTQASLTIQIPTEGLVLVAPPPETITQRNVEAVTGVPPETYLATIRAPGFPLKVSKLGKLRIVDRAAFVAYLRDLTEGATTEPSDGVDAVLAEVSATRRGR